MNRHPSSHLNFSHKLGNYGIELEQFKMQHGHKSWGGHGLPIVWNWGHKLVMIITGEDPGIEGGRGQSLICVCAKIAPLAGHTVQGFSGWLTKNLWVSSTKLTHARQGPS